MTPPLIPRRTRGIGSLDPDERRKLIESRRRFLIDGVEPIGGVSPAIVRSWRRSQAYGLDMDARPSLESLSHRQLRELKERNELLLRAARGELEALHEDARSTGSVVILTDPMGVILATVGNIDFAERASRVALRPGVQWSEAAIGTNAIGTAIAEGRPVSVNGAEHFFVDHAILGCSAMPILDPSGEIIGVLDFSNDAVAQQPHTLALVRRAVDQIEQRLFHQRFGRHERMHFHTDPDLVMSPHEGLLAFEGPRLVGANRQGLDLLGLDWSVLGLVAYDQIFDTGREQLAFDGPAEAARIRTRRGSVVFGLLKEGAGEAATVHRAPKLPAISDQPRPPFEAAVRALLDRAVRLADAGVPILVLGEIGCGKDAFVRTLHAESRLGGGPFVVVDCSHDDAAVVETRLFGDAAGRGGAFAEAAGGSLHLHAIETLPLRLQVRLARSLSAERPAAEAFNVLTTSHFALADRVAAGGFSRDLMMRVAAHTVELVPLREIADRRALIGEFWAAVAPQRYISGLPEETAAVLAAYEWPGNRRQLIATLRSLVVLAEAGEKLAPTVLPHEIREAKGSVGETSVSLDVEEGLESITLAVMRAAVEAEGGNIARAARRLGIHRSTLYRRLHTDDQASD